jgi:hypothetical protein
MKTLPPLAACVLALACSPAMAQTPTTQEVTRTAQPPPPAPHPDELTKFDLNFQGGTPMELVAAIQEAMRHRLNAIVPDEFADVNLPTLRMEHVNVAQLFEALALAGRKSEAVNAGHYGGPFPGQPSMVETGYYFRQGSQGKPTDDTIWYFHVDKPVLPPYTSTAKICRFYSLAPYLRGRYTVDDITTAIETGWKMLGDTSPPALSFHKDTNLLIVVGEPSRLETVDSVLHALEGSKTDPGSGVAAGGAIDPATGLPATAAPRAAPPTPKPAGKAKSDEK